ncbi:site-specific integrase [Kocuria sp. SM24M-10]|uniref:tyrosine-type recombinase/integrase n=1 Tax=Kocuria sp. SM24M-10 TaxID=1660349 RepID=UPI00064B06D7|nr:site-specific integrase [Kocuria sp. SM24M-10]KLU10008.1 integrase [Kocuria sp. SM24M-10]
MATIESYATKAGRRYRVRYRTPDRRQTDRRGFTTKRDAERFARTVEVSKDRGEWIDPADARATVGELAGPWLDGKRSLKPSSFRPLDAAWRVHVAPRWAAVPVGEVRPSDVQAWITALSTGDEAADPPVKPKSATTVLRAYGVLAGILDAAVKDRRLLANPARTVDTLPRKTRKQHVYLSHEQVHAVADAAKYPVLVLVLAYCGLRWGEAVALRVKDVDLQRRRLTVHENAVEVGGRIHVGTPKGHRARTVPFPRFLGERLAGQLEGKAPADLVFPGPEGGHLRTARVHADNYSWFASALDAAGAPRITPHDLRHTAASFAVSAGANVKAVQRMLGHSSAAMTLDVYADLFDRDLDAVADALDQAVSRSSVGRMWADDAAQA